MQPTPRNKLYMTREDFPSYNDEIARVYRQLHPKEEDKEDDMLCQGRDLLRDRGVQPGLHLLLRVPQDQPPDELGNGKAVVDGCSLGSLWTTPPRPLSWILLAASRFWKSSSSTKRSNILSARRFPCDTHGPITT